MDANLQVMKRLCMKEVFCMFLPETSTNNRLDLVKFLILLGSPGMFCNTF